MTTVRAIPKGQRAAFVRYRFMALLTGTLLLILVFVGLPLQFWANSDGVAAVVGTAHGFLFMVYLVTAADLGLRRRWKPVRFLLILVAGTIPFLSFVMERSVHNEMYGGRQIVPMGEA